MIKLMINFIGAFLCIAFFGVCDDRKIDELNVLAASNDRT